VARPSVTSIFPTAELKPGFIVKVEVGGHATVGTVARSKPNRTG
jgi:hypothetical protein